MPDTTERLAGLLAEHREVECFTDGTSGGVWRNYACSCGWWSTADQQRDFRAHVAAVLTEAGVGFVAEADPPALLADLRHTRVEHDAAERERDELERRLSETLCDLTRGKLSKPTYSVRTMVQAVEQEFDEDVSAAEARAERAEAALADLRSRVRALANDPFDVLLAARIEALLAEARAEGAREALREAADAMSTALDTFPQQGRHTRARWAEAFLRDRAEQIGGTP